MKREDIGPIYQSADSPTSPDGPDEQHVSTESETSELDRHEMVDDEQDDKKENAEAKARTDQLLFDRQ
jgi:hypothetical protein